MKGVLILNIKEPYIGMPINLSAFDESAAEKKNRQEQKKMEETSCPLVPKGMQEMKLAMAYVPWQHWRDTYNYDEGFKTGTIFPELDFPFLGYKGARYHD